MCFKDSSEQNPKSKPEALKSLVSYGSSMALPNKPPGFVRLLAQVLELRTAHCLFRMEKHQPHYLPMEKWKVFPCRRTLASLPCELRSTRLLGRQLNVFLPMLQVVGQTSGHISGLCSKTLPRSYFLNASHLRPCDQ